MSFVIRKKYFPFVLDEIRLDDIDGSEKREISINHSAVEKHSEFKDGRRRRTGNKKRVKIQTKLKLVAIAFTNTADRNHIVDYYYCCVRAYWCASALGSSYLTSANG